LNKIFFYIWLIAFALLFGVGPFVILFGRGLFKRIAERDSNWATDTSGLFNFFSESGSYWPKILRGEFDGLNSDLKASCKWFRFLIIIYLLCFFAALAGQVFFIFDGGIKTN